MQYHFLKSKTHFAVINIGNAIIKKGSIEKLLGVQ